LGIWFSLAKCGRRASGCYRAPYYSRFALCCQIIKCLLHSACQSGIMRAAQCARQGCLRSVGLPLWNHAAAVGGHRASYRREKGGTKVSFADKTLTCRDCGNSFVWTSGEQEFYASKGLENAPSRCPACRAERRRGGSAGGRREGSSEGRQLYPAVCAACGKETEVPFQPRQDRPVYCSDCFQKRRGGS
jgi:CxxC-x17-CxxC domain-containing protein